MATSAEVTYSAVQVGSVFNYEITLYNTSPVPFDIYAFMFGWQYNVPITGSFPLHDIVFIGAPPGWTGSPSSASVTWQTSFQGSSILSGYILAGQSGTFAFQSSTSPPDTLPFGCCYYDNSNKWGFCFNGTAERKKEQGRVPSYAYINPLVLVLGDEVFVRINLPRPPYTADLRAQLAPGIQSMTPAQRETASRALEHYIAAFTEVRAALK